MLKSDEKRVPVEHTLAVNTGELHSILWVLDGVETQKYYELDKKGNLKEIKYDKE